MDNKKIGNLIASLRRKQGMTQQELGDKVGVGFRAVSKWERGITLPDIGIINDLSKILEISSDELLSGELKEHKSNNNKKKISIKIKIIIAIIVLISILITSIIIYNNNRTYMYEIENIENTDYYIEGNILIHKNNMTLIIEQITFTDRVILMTEIEGYEFQIKSNDKLLYGYGHIDTGQNIYKQMTVKDFVKEFKTNLIFEIDLSRIRIISNEISLIFKFTGTNNNEITKELKFTAKSSNN